MNGREKRLQDALRHILTELKRAEGTGRALTPLEHLSAEKLRNAARLVQDALGMLGDDDTDDW